MELKVNINGKDRVFSIGADEMLLDVLRREGYRGVKRGCNKGDCGACTVLIDGRSYNSCIVPAPSVQDRKVVTIEGIGTKDSLHPLQEAFIEEGAVQCGYCTPGMILSAKALLDVRSEPTDREIKIALDGNLCRCTGYAKILEAVKKAAREMREVKQ